MLPSTAVTQVRRFSENCVDIRVVSGRIFRTFCSVNNLLQSWSYCLAEDISARINLNLGQIYVV